MPRWGTQCQLLDSGEFFKSFKPTYVMYNLFQTKADEDPICARYGVIFLQGKCDVDLILEEHGGPFGNHQF